jgi:hypothetical protein
MIRAVVPTTVAHAINRLASAAGKSRSRVVAEFLTEAEPSIRRLAGMLEVAKSQQDMFPKALVLELEAALDALSGTQQEVLERLGAQLPLIQAAAKQSARASAASGATGRSRRRRKTPVQ